MTLKEVFATLEQSENGDRLIVCIKTESAKLRKEAELSRKKCAALQQQLNEQQQLYQISQQKLLTSELINTLYQGRALYPPAMARLILDDITITADGKYIFHYQDNEYDLSSGVSAWLQDNKWAVEQTSTVCCCRAACQEVKPWTSRI